MRGRPNLLRLLPVAIVIGFVLLAFAPVSTVLSSDTTLPTLLFTAAPRYDGLAWVHGGDRFSSGASLFLQDASGRHSLVPNFAASADPAVSFDGKKVLFAGKQRAQDHWQIWQTELASSPDSALVSGPPRRLTSCVEDCFRPFYLPDDRVVYAEKTGEHFVIEVVDPAESDRGKATLQLTYGPGNFLPTDILRDGRILFEGAYPLGSTRTPELYTVYSDGSGVESYRCDHGNVRHSGRQLASGDIVFPSGYGLSRFTSARAQEIQISAPPGEYAGDLAETALGEWLLAWRPDANAYFEIRRWKLGNRDLLPGIAATSTNAIQPTLVAERPTPKRHPSGLHDWKNANLLCLNAYTSKYEFGAKSIHSLRLYTRDSAGGERLLGSTPVEPDGSFFVQVPAEQPLQIALLDAAGKVLKREAGWFWMRRGEQRGCVGCHAGPETAPENAVPMVLLKSTTPADLTGASTSASGGH